MQFDQQPRVFLLLADDDDPTIQIAREILESPLGLARDVVCRLFNGDFPSLREDLDIVKGFAAGITRASAMRDYRLADYYTLMFAFHQWFHSSYRARQGKVLEELLKRILPLCTSFQVLETNQALPLLQNLFYPQAANKGKWPKSDIDVIGVTADQGRLLLVQLRSRDDTGGTTAKGSLADALKELIRGGGSPSAHVLYLIGIWDARESQQRISTINKIRSSLQDLNLPYDFSNLEQDIGRGADLTPNIRLQLAYGSKEIIEAITDWAPAPDPSASQMLSKTVQRVEEWDDLWVAYAIASVELELQALRGISNVYLLRSKCKELGIELEFHKYSELQALVEKAVDSLIVHWKEDSLPVKAPADQALYLRDLLFLSAIYEKYCPQSGEAGTLVARDSGAHPWPYQLPLFSDTPPASPHAEGEPYLVSFRALAPEITDTNYLTHGLFYYPAKFIPQVPRFCLKEYTAKGDWVIDPFAGSATVGLEAVLMGRNALLLDLNPLLNHIVPLKILFRYDVEPETLRRMLDEMRHAAESSEQEAPIFLPDLANITYWYDPDVLSLLSRYWGWLKAQDDSPYIRIIELALLKASKYFSYAEHRTPKLFKSKAKRAEMQNLLQGDWKTRLDDLIYTTALDAGNRLNYLTRQLRYQSGEVIYRGGVDSSNPEAFGDIPPYPFKAIITSPPYLQAQEYIRTFKLDLSWLGYPEERIRQLSRLEIPYRKAERLISTPTLEAIRASLRREDLRAMLDSYFYYTLRALENAVRLLTPGGVLCVFVGNPNVDEFEVETWRIMSEYFGERHLELVQVYEDRIKNRQLFRGRKNKNPEGIQSEFLLIMRKH
jgi:DNA modification methylase